MAKFKMKQLALAMGAVLGTMSMVPSAQAVNVATDNLGQVLIFPYYTVRGGWNTLLNVTNTSNRVVAAKVRFHESHNSRDVFDFNLILSPHDVWTATVSNNVGPDGNPDTTDDVPILTTNDNSCTAPAIPTEGIRFQTPEGNPNGRGAYTGGANDGGPQDASRMREGYVVILMMGASQLPPFAAGSLAAAAVHNASGRPANCPFLVEAFNNQHPTGTGPAPGWLTVQSTFPYYNVEPASGSAPSTPISAPLTASFSLVNSANGWNATGKAVALANFYDTTVAATSFSGKTNPSLVTLQLPPTAIPSLPFIATYHEPELSSANIPSSSGAVGADGVTSVLARSNVYNQGAWRADAATGWVTASDWVVSYPTKRFYVDLAGHQFAGRAVGRPGLPAGLAPFSTPFGPVTAGGAASSCDPVEATIYNREERSISAGPVFSPSLPGFSLCREVNVLTFGGANVLGAQGSGSLETLDANGWMDLNVAPSGGAGLPAVGFSIITRQGNDGLNEAFLIP